MRSVCPSPAAGMELHLRHAAPGPGLAARRQDADLTAGHQPRLMVRQHKAAIVGDEAEPGSAVLSLPWFWCCFFKGSYSCQHRMS